MDAAKIIVNAPKHFYISGVNFAQPKNYAGYQKLTRFIDEHGIDTIVNVSDYQTGPNLLMLYESAGLSNIISYPLDDAYVPPAKYQELQKVLDSLYRKMGNRVLVNCTAGVNRSALVIAYALIKSTYLSPEEVINIIRTSNYGQRGAQSLTNPSFVRFLNSLERRQKLE